MPPFIPARSKSSENHYVVLFPDGSAEEVEYPDPDGGVEVCYTKEVLSKKLKEFAKGPLRAAIDYACRKNKLIEAAKETAHLASEKAVRSLTCTPAMDRQMDRSMD